MRLFPRRTIQLVLTLCAIAVIEIHAQSTLIPLTTRRDMVFDHAGHYLYITTRDGFVQRYNLSTNQIDTSYNLGGSLNGLDIAPDDSFLLVAQSTTASNGQGTFHRVDLATGTITNITFPLGSDEESAYDVAIASNGLALVTASAPSVTVLRQIDLSNNAITQRSDAPFGIGGTRLMRRSADRRTLSFSGSQWGVMMYDAATNTFSPLQVINRGLSPAIALSRNGTILAASDSGWASFNSTPDCSYIHSFNGVDSGIAFDPMRDVFYGVNSSTGEIVAYDSNTFSELFRLDIGETVNPSRYDLDIGKLVASDDGRLLALATVNGVRVISCPATLAPPATPPATLATRRGMVFDHSGQFLYVATSTGQVQRYNLALAAIDRTYDIGGILKGIDIIGDDAFLLVAQGGPGLSQGVIHKLDLTDGSVTNIPFLLGFSDSGSASYIAIAANGRAFFGQDLNGPLHQIDLATNSVTERTVSPTAPRNAQIQRSADGSRLYFLGADNSSGPVTTYQAQTDSFTSTISTNNFLDTASGAVSHDGSLIATRIANHASIDTAPDYAYRHSFNNIDSGLAFDGTADRLYIVDRASDQIVAYDSNNFSELFRININEALPTFAQFDSGNLVASPDGHHLALATPSTVRVFTIPDPLPSPTPEPPSTLGTARDMVFDSPGNYLYITTAEGSVQRYNVQTDTLDRDYQVGGFLNAIDIAPDDSALFVAQGTAGLTQGAIEKIDLTTGTVSHLVYPLAEYESSAWDIVVGSNGLALFTAQETGFGWLPVRQLDLTTNTISTRTDVPGSFGSKVTNGTYVRRSADRNVVYLSDNPVFTYNAATNTFGPKFNQSVGMSAASMAVNRNGTLLATRYGEDIFLQTAPNFSLTHTFATFDVDPSRRAVSGIAFDAAKDVLYAVRTYSNQIYTYDTNTFTLKSPFPINIGENVDPSTNPRFGPGNLVASQNGDSLALITPTAVRIYDVAAVPTPTATVTPSQTVTIPVISPSAGTFKKKVFVKISCATSGATIYYTTDGSDPTTTSNVYVAGKKNKGFKITGIGSHIVKAMAAESAYNNSAIATANFVIN